MYFIFLYFAVPFSLITVPEMFKSSLPCVCAFIISSGCLISCVLKLWSCMLLITGSWFTKDWTKQQSVNFLVNPVDSKLLS